MQGELRELLAKNREMKDELNEAHAQLAKLKAVAAQGSDAEKARAALEQETAAQAAELKYGNLGLDLIFFLFLSRSFSFFLFFFFFPFLFLSFFFFW